MSEKKEEAPCIKFHIDGTELEAFEQVVERLAEKVRETSNEVTILYKSLKRMRKEEERWLRNRRQYRGKTTKRMKQRKQS